MFSRLFGSNQTETSWRQFSDEESSIGDHDSSQSFEMEEVEEGDEVDEAEEELVENTTKDDPFLFFAGDDLVGDEDEDEEEDENGSRKKSGWESKNEVARVAKRISRHLYRLKEQQLQAGRKPHDDRQSNGKEQEEEEEEEEEEKERREGESKFNKSTGRRTRNSRRISRRRKSEIEEEELQRAAVLGSTKRRCGILPRRADHVFMTFLCWILVLTIGTGLLVAGLMGDSKSMQITRHETRTLTIPSTWWYDCLDFTKMSLRQSSDGTASRVYPKSSEVQFFVFDSSSPPPYHKNQTSTYQIRDVFLGTGDTNLHYLQFYINKGGSAIISWSFHPAPGLTTYADVDVLWVKGSDLFKEIAAAGDSPGATPIAKSRIAIQSSGVYRVDIQENNDYYLVFRHYKGGSAMKGTVSTSVATPTYDLNNQAYPPIKKMSGLGDLCFPFKSNPFVVMAVDFKTETFEGENPGNGATEDLVTVYFEFPKRIPFSMSVSGGLLALIFLPIILVWIAMACKERTWRRRKTQRTTSPTHAPAPAPTPPTLPPTAVVVVAAPPVEGEQGVQTQVLTAPLAQEQPRQPEQQPTHVDEDDWW